MLKGRVVESLASSKYFSYRLILKQIALFFLLLLIQDNINKSMHIGRDDNECW